MTATRTGRTIYQATLGLLLLLPAASAAQERVQWRTDYNAARKEANEKSLPLFLDFGTEDCYHCRRLDASTFRDAAIIRVLNERFIPLKVDANREPALSQALRIQAYPTLILAGNDGKILGMVEGYMEAGRLMEHLNRALSTSVPDWMARDFQEATKAVSAADYSRAVSLLRNIVEDGKARPIQEKAKQVLLEIEQQALGRLARAKQLEDKGQSLEAVNTLTDMLSRYAGTQAAADGTKLLTSIADKPEIRNHQRFARSQELLAMAKEEFKAERFLPCLDHCEVLTSTYRDTPAGVEGAQLAAEVRGNTERMAKACDAMTERLGQMYVAQAESWMKKGNPKEAAACLEKVVALCPNSPYAENAQTRLAQIKSKTPTTPVQFRKP